jgi:hypothetical protein
MGPSTSWSSAFDNHGSPSQRQLSTPGVADASCAAVAATTAVPVDRPVVSADLLRLPDVNMYLTIADKLLELGVHAVSKAVTMVGVYWGRFHRVHDR